MAFFCHVQQTVRMVSNMTRSTVWIYQEHIMASLLPEAYPCVTCLSALCLLCLWQVWWLWQCCKQLTFYVWLFDGFLCFFNCEAITHTHHWHLNEGCCEWDISCRSRYTQVTSSLSIGPAEIHRSKWQKWNFHEEDDGLKGHSTVISGYLNKPVPITVYFQTGQNTFLLAKWKNATLTGILID